MLQLRHLLLVVVLFFAQLAAGAHAVEHAASNDDGLPTHVCQLCLAAHDLGAALPSLAALPPVLAVQLVPESFSAHGRNAFPAPIATQQGPPLF
ncbi:hypothetical protein [Ferribacterium limneticum]|uniref:hypothetical protein n=1 Tax=Ferribacterium limneticum TaxID=76259 RepID=UPI001CFB3219|nr:hypothetical protein [Ferribacterium limneticum]UCV19212.1 hypothetical protein KI610_01055 [Ferribacterium limneticum]